MKLIQQIKIENFRSIESQTIQDLSTFNVLVGKNSSGKSNVLRALNLLFNNEVEPGKGIDFTRDYFLRATPSKKKKRISITVDFALPKTFKFRQGLESLVTFGT